MYLQKMVYLKTLLVLNDSKKAEVCSILQKCSNSYIFATRCRRPLLFQTVNSVRWTSLSLKYQRSTPSGCKGIGNRKL